MATAPPATATALPSGTGIQEAGCTGVQAGYTETLAEAWFSPMSNALLVIVPGSVGITTTSMVAVAPEGRVPRSHWILGSPSGPTGTKLHSPWLAVAETSSTPAGKESLTPTWSKAKGWLLVSVMVKATGSPTLTASALA